MVHKQRKGFYQDSLEYFEYDESLYENEYGETYHMDDNEISYYIWYVKNQP